MKSSTEFFWNIFILLVFLFILDRGLSSLISYFLLREKQGDSSITTHAVLRANEDILIFGSSRAAHHYVPSLIKKRTKLSCFNLGRDGMGLMYSEALLRAVLSYHTPKIIILDLNTADFGIDKVDKDMVTTFLPYIGKNREVDKLVYNEDRIEFYIATVSKLYRYNSLPFSILQHSLGIGQRNYHGYEPLLGSKLAMMTVNNNIESNYEEADILIQAFENFVKLAQEKNIELFVVVSPRLYMPKQHGIITANKILAKYRLECLDYTAYFNSKTKYFFYDPSHLNDAGARAFTQELLAKHLNKTL